jgi:hypothetical protein
MTASGKVKGTIKIGHRRISSNAVLVVSKLVFIGHYWCIMVLFRIPEHFFRPTKKIDSRIAR